MDTNDDLSVPGSSEEEARAAPIIRCVAEVAGAFAGADGWVSPSGLETAVSVAEVLGELLKEPSLTRVLVFRALSSPQSPRVALAALRSAAASLPAPQRAAIMHELLRLLTDDSKPTIAGLRGELAGALDVPLPDHLRNDGRRMLDAVGSLADRAMKLVRPDKPIVVAARDFALDFGESQLLAAVDEIQRGEEPSRLIVALRVALDAVQARVEALTRAADAQTEALAVAQELDEAANRIDGVARQRFAAITRRAALLKRHLREDLNALATDAAEEFETDLRRVAESKRGWFGKLDTTDLNDRVVVKNLERRYNHLARRYQDQLDLLDREVAEFCEEFTQVSDEALRPIARHELHAIAPHANLEQRVKVAADRASTHALVAGAAGAVASGAAVQTGVITTAAMVGAAVTPVGAVVLGAAALAGLWKMLASPGERRRRDVRQRAQALEEQLRQEIMANLPLFPILHNHVMRRGGSARSPPRIGRLPAVLPLPRTHACSACWH
jgi:hypothetical protein